MINLELLQAGESVSATYAQLTPLDIEGTTCSCVKDDYCLHVVDRESLQAVESVYSQYLFMIFNQ